MRCLSFGPIVLRFAPPPRIAAAVTTAFLLLCRCLQSANGEDVVAVLVDEHVQAALSHSTLDELLPIFTGNKLESALLAEKQAARTGVSLELTMGRMAVSKIPKSADVWYTTTRDRISSTAVLVSLWEHTRISPDQVYGKIPLQYELYLDRKRLAEGTIPIYVEDTNTLKIADHKRKEALVEGLKALNSRLIEEVAQLVFTSRRIAPVERDGKLLLPLKCENPFDGPIAGEVEVLFDERILKFPLSIKDGEVSTLELTLVENLSALPPPEQRRANKARRIVKWRPRSLQLADGSSLLDMKRKKDDALSQSLQGTWKVLTEPTAGPTQWLGSITFFKDTVSLPFPPEPGANFARGSFTVDAAVYPPRIQIILPSAGVIDGVLEIKGQQGRMRLATAPRPESDAPRFISFDSADSNGARLLLLQRQKEK